MKNILILLFTIQIYWVSHNCYMAIDLKHLKMKNILKIPEIVQESISDLIKNSNKTTDRTEQTSTSVIIANFCSL